MKPTGCAGKLEMVHASLLYQGMLSRISVYIYSLICDVSEILPATVRGTGDCALFPHLFTYAILITLILLHDDQNL